MVTEKLRQTVPILFSALLGTSTLVALGAFVGGCENPTAQADKTVNQQVETAEAKNGNTHDRKALIAALDAAAKNDKASPDVKVDVRLQQARQETDAGDEMARAAGGDQIEIARLAGQIQSLTGQIAANNLLIDGLNKRKPDEGLKGVDDAAAAAKGSGDTATWGSPDKGVPAGSAVDAESAKINADIQKLTAEKTTLDTTQKQNTDDARKLEEQASKTHGTEARDAGIKAAGLRRDARNASTRIEQIDRAVAGFQDQLKVEDARKGALAEADKAFQDRKAQIAAAWDELKKQIDVYQDQSKKLLEGNGDAREQPTTGKAPTTQPKVYDATNPPSEEDMAAAQRNGNVTRLALLVQQELAKYSADNKEALERYDTANKLITEAQGLAEKVVKDLPKKISEKEARNGLTELFGPNDFKIRLATIRMKVAQLHADQADTVAVLDDAHTTLSATLEKAGMQMPAELTSLPPASTVTDLRKQADDEYTEADTALDQIGQGTGTTPRAKSDQAEARKMQVAELYARSKNAQRAGDNAKAETQLTSAKNLLQTLNSDTPLPESFYLAPELSSAIRQIPKLPPLATGGGPTSLPRPPSVPGGIFAPPSTAPATAPSATTLPATPAGTPAAPDTGTPPATPAGTPATPDTGTTPPATPAGTPATPDTGTTPPATPATAPATPDAGTTATPPPPPAPDAGTTPPATPATPPAPDAPK